MARSKKKALKRAEFKRAREAAKAAKAALKPGQPAVTVVCGPSQWVVRRDRLRWSPALLSQIVDGGLTVTEDVDVFLEVLRFMQISKYECPRQDLLLHMRVNRMAARYGLSRLANEARITLARGLKKAWHKPAMADAIMDAYSTDDATGLRRPIVYATLDYIGQLRETPSEYADFWAAAAACPQFEEDLETMRKDERIDDAAKKTAFDALQSTIYDLPMTNAKFRAMTKKQRLEYRRFKKAAKESKVTAKRAARNKFNSPERDPTPNRDEGHAIWSGAEESGSEVESSDAQSDDDVGMSREDFDGIQDDNVIAQRMRERPSYYVKGQPVKFTAEQRSKQDRTNARKAK